MNQSIQRQAGYQSRIWTSTVRLFCWGVAWVAATALMKFGPRVFWNGSTPLTVAAIGLNLCAGVGMILANRNYLMELDELQRRVYLNALAFAVGVSLIAGIPLSVMDTYGLIPFHAQIWHVIMIMSVTFCVSIVYGNLRYR